MLKRFLASSLGYLPAKLLPALTGFISAPILTHLLLPAEYGSWALAEGVAEFLFALACSGLGSIPVRLFAAYQEKDELGVFMTTLGANVGAVIAVVGGASFLALALFREQIPPNLYPLLSIAILIFMARSVHVIALEVVRAQERSGLYSLFELINRYGGLGLGLLLIVVFGFGVEGLLWGTLLTLLLLLPFVLPAAFRRASVRPNSFRRSDALHMWRYAWPLALGNTAMWGLRLSDRYVIGWLRSETEVGLYSVAYNISDRSISLLVSLFVLSLFPLVLNTWEREGREATEKALIMISRLYMVVCLPATVGLGLLSLPVVKLLTSESYHEGHRIVWYVALSSFVFGLWNIMLIGPLIKQKTRRIALNQGIAALANLVLTVVLVRQFGFVGAGIATLIGYLGLLGFQIYSSRRYFEWRFPLGTVRNVLVATAFMSLVTVGAYPLLTRVGLPVWAALLLTVLIAAIVYATALLLVGEATDQEKAMARRLLGLVRIQEEI